MTIKKTARKLLSAALAVCVMAGSIMVPAQAAEAEKETFNYVSIGASNTNGYGMRGYITEEELDLLLSGQVSKDEVNVYGYERKPEGAYPDLIRDHYVDLYGADNVNINQLAISSMRVEELRILLDDTYMGDDYSEWRFTGDDGWFKSAEEGGIPALREAYQNSIANADLITMDIGWNNFGVYVCNQLVDYMSNGKYKWTTDINAIYDTDAEDHAAAEAKAIIGEYIKSYVGEGEMTTALTDIFAYSILGYMHNFDICMEKIYTLNPDATVVTLGIQNLLHGVVVDLNGEQIPLGDIFGNFVNMANYYISACSPYQSKYQYVKSGNDEHVTIFLDYMKTYNGDAEHLDQNVKDCFDYYDNDLFIQTRVDYMAAAMIEENYGDMLGVIGYDSAEDVVADGKAGKLSDSLQETFDSMYWPALYAAYDTLAVLVKEIANYASVDANGLLAGTVDIGAVEDALKTALEDEITENALAAADGKEYTVDLEKLLPDTDTNTKVVAAMYIRYYMGNSFFAHPNGTGHAEIKDAVFGVLNNPESETDQNLADYLMKSVCEIHTLICGATGHAQSFTHTVKATCAQEGAEVASCSCGTEKTETVLEKTAHDHQAGQPVWAEDHTSCTIALTCTSCGDVQEVTDDTITSEVTKEAACEAEGEIVYTADFSESDRINTAVTTTEVIPATGHAMVDGVCTTCGHTDAVVEPEEGVCTYLAEQTLTSGQTYVLTLGGTDVGSYTFTQIEGGWAIQVADGTYLALEDEAMISSAEAFAWTYADGCFSAKVAGTSSGSNWFDNIFGSWRGSSSQRGNIFGNWWWGSGSDDETYYLVASGAAVAVSTSNANAQAKFYQEVTGEHVFGDPVANNGSHVSPCLICDAVKSESCTDADCTLCHPAAPEVSIKVSVDVTSSSSGNSWFQNIFGGSFGNWWGSSSTTYTATITVEAEGTKVESVAYSTDGGSTWSEGTTFTSSSEINAFDIRVEAANGQTYYFTYSNGSVTPIA